MLMMCTGKWKLYSVGILQSISLCVCPTLSLCHKWILEANSYSVFCSMSAAYNAVMYGHRDAFNVTCNGSLHLFCFGKFHLLTVTDSLCM